MQGWRPEFCRIEPTSIQAAFPSPQTVDLAPSGRTAAASCSLWTPKGASLQPRWFGQSRASWGREPCRARSGLKRLSNVCRDPVLRCIRGPEGPGSISASGWDSRAVNGVRLAQGRAAWALKRRDRIDRRAHPLFDSQWRCGEQELVSAKTLRHFGKPLEVEVVEDPRAQRDQREPVQREGLIA